MERVEASSIPAAALDEAQSALAVTEAQLEQAQRDNESLAAQADALSDALSRCEAELTTLQDVRETNEDAIAGLESLLVKIENKVRAPAVCRPVPD